VTATNGDVRATVVVVGHASHGADQVCEAIRRRRIRAFGPVDPSEIQHIPAGLKADAAILDLRSNDLGDATLGTVCRRIAPLTLVITDLTDVDTRLKTLRFGVADSIVAPFDEHELIERLEILLARRRRARNGRVTLGDIVFEPGARTLSRFDVTVSLTERELQIFEALLMANGRAVSKQELVQQVWNGQARTLNSVEAHVSALRRKLEQLDVRMVHTVHGHGYAFRAPPERAEKRESLLQERERLLRERDAAVARRDELMLELRQFARRESLS
jgi:DNA-binding response OmpR family regulator